VVPLTQLFFNLGFFRGERPPFFQHSGGTLLDKRASGGFWGKIPNLIFTPFEKGFPKRPHVSLMGDHISFYGEKKLLGMGTSRRFPKKGF